MRKITSFLFSAVLLATTLVSLTPSPASAATTLITCTDLTTRKTVALKETQKSCRPLLATAIWHIQQSDSAAHTGAGYANLRTCTSNRAEFKYQLIKSLCAKYQVTNDYWRSAVLPAKPVITRASSDSHESVFLTLASESATNTDAPIVYYTIASNKGDVKKVNSWRDLTIVVSGLSSSTSYTFTITATSVDGTSPVSASSLPVTTQVYVAPVVAVAAAPAPAPVASCQNNGICIVGDIGPGGGIVFYVALIPFECGTSTYTTTCLYLEAARTLWNAGATEPTRTWAQGAPIKYDTETVNNAGAPESATATAIGWGERNTEAIILQGNSDSATSAAALADSYAVAFVGTFFAGYIADDWYLPSRDELNQLCKWARGITGDDLTNLTTVCDGGDLNTGAGAAGFAPDTYWSSSEVHAYFSYLQGFHNGMQGGFYKENSFYVRPIRAFYGPLG
jgi:hypothetical protein